MQNLAGSVLVSLAALALGACSGGPGGPAPAASSASAERGAAAQKSGSKTVEIKKLGLRGTAAGETEDPIVGDGETMLIAFGKFTVTVSPAKDIDPKTVDDAKAAAALFKPEKQKQEALKDGWVLTYENTGSAGANYFVNARRDIDGKGYLCDTIQTTPDQQKAAVDFCKSLAKL